jgi:hypothetical protein
VGGSSGGRELDMSSPSSTSCCDIAYSDSAAASTASAWPRVSAVRPSSSSVAAAP